MQSSHLSAEEEEKGMPEYCNAGVKIGDKVVIENEDLCLKKDKSSLKCDIILCSL